MDHRHEPNTLSRIVDDGPLAPLAAERLEEALTMTTRIYLIPGFLGFHSFGSVIYFRRVPELLAQLLAERGITDAVIKECPTFPAGSLARRAERALACIADSSGHKADSIHLVGHSTGGLDARLVAAPGVRLIAGAIEEEIGARIRSVITLSTPHFGTPMADILLALPFRRSLEYLGWVGASNKGRLAILALSRVLQLVARSDDWMGRTNTSLDSLAYKILKRITVHSNDPVWEFLAEMGQDQGAVVQLTMASLHLFNAAVADRPGTRYSSVITVAPPPSYRLSRAESVSPVKLASKVAFWTLYGMASRASRQYPYTAMDVEQMSLAGFSSPLPITKYSNDGVVPCQSQAYGRILDVVLGDHLDVVGQFPFAGGDPHADWLPSGANFDEARFRHVWTHVAQEIVDAEAHARGPAATPGIEPIGAKP
jgi:pimeloyl-ACP methyl ester carboxylesterase